MTPPDDVPDRARELAGAVAGLRAIARTDPVIGDDVALVMEEYDRMRTVVEAARAYVEHFGPWSINDWSPKGQRLFRELADSVKALDGETP